MRLKSTPRAVADRRPCTSVLLQHELHRVADCRHRALGDQQDDTHVLEPLVTSTQSPELLRQQLHICSTMRTRRLRDIIHPLKLSNFISFSEQCFARGHLLQVEKCQFDTGA